MDKRNSGRTWRFWPYGPRRALLAALILLTSSLIGFFLLKLLAGWPRDDLELRILIGVSVISAIPILLMVLEDVARSGGSLEGFGFKVNFGAVVVAAAEQSEGAVVPPNIGVAEGLRIYDSGGPQVLQAIRSFAATDVALIDLENGTAWWETRLAVVCSGARRLGRPKAIAFVATDAGKARIFQGWAEPGRLLDALCAADPQLRLAVDKAATASARWALAYPPEDPPTSAKLPFPGDPYENSSGVAFTGSTRTIDAPEQFLLHEMIRLEEHRPKVISIVRLHDLFGAFLSKDALEESLPEQKWLEAALCTDTAFLAVTRCGRYVGLLTQMAVLTHLLHSRLFPDLKCDTCISGAQNSTPDSS